MADTSKHFTIRNNLKEVASLALQVDEFAATTSLSSKALFNIHLTLEEFLTNIIKYGYEDSTDHDIDVNLACHDEDVEITIQDDGSPFDPTEAPTGDTLSALSDRVVGGLGIHLVKEMSKDLSYRYENGRNIVTVIISSD